MSPVPVSVEESRAQRQQKLQSRFRDRGGIFVPSDKNTLVDILLARSVTGESPRKRQRSRQKEESGSLLACDKGKSKASDTGQEHAEHLLPGKATGKSKSTRTSSKKLKGKVVREDEDGLSDCGQHVAGPSRPDSCESINPALAVSVPKRKGRPPKIKSSDKSSKNDADDDVPTKKPKPRGRSTSKLSSKPDDIDRTSTEVPAKPKKATKRRKRTAESDDDGVSSDYMPPSRKRAKVATARAPKTARKKPAQAVQLEDSDDDSAIVITVKKKDKADSAHATTGLKKSGPPVSSRSSKPTSKSCLASKAQKKLSLYIDDDDDDEVSEKLEPTAPNSWATSRGARAKRTDADATSTPKLPVVATKPSKDVANFSPESDFDLNEAPLQVVTKAKTAVKSTRTTGALKKGRQPQKRQLDVADSEQSALPPPARKRAKAVQPPGSDEALAKLTESIDAGVIRRAEKTATSKSSSRKLKENDEIPKHRSTAQRAKQSQQKPSQKVSRKGPPQEVLNRIKSRPPPSSPHTDSDTDPIDFLS